jgi:TRAP-type C4-dicarboxylate transport system substrate-binding protein
MGTLAPKASPWGKAFSTWSTAVSQKTKGEVQIEWLWNGVAGQENAVVGKIQSGQLSGAAITASGLGKVHKPILALQMPGAFSSWGALDAQRDKLGPEFAAALKSQGLYIGGWGDMGVARIMSNGFEVRSPDDLKGKSPAQSYEDILSPKVYEVIGGVTPKVLGIGDILGNLQSGQVNVILATALAAEQLQWAPRLTHINDLAVAYGIGALVMSEKQLAALPADQRDIIEKTAAIATKALTSRIRAADDEAYGRLKGRLKVVTPSGDETAKWKSVFKEACGRAKSTIPGNVLTRIGAC